ncbi:transposase domain-containing protein [Pseudomonas sp. MF7448]|uniref:transposase domain-containing protein n=1 Tax=Pseudomonas sp. MF7448 TaxID=2797537 RepID=UPI003FA3B6AB
MTSSPNLDQMSPDQLRALAAQLLSQVDTMGKKINRDQTVIEKLTHEIAQLKRFKFAKRSEQLNPDQASLLDDPIDTDIAAIEAGASGLANSASGEREKSKSPSAPRCRQSFRAR